MTVTFESERHLHRPRVYIPDPTNIVSLYTLSHLTNFRAENFIIYYQSTEESEEEELVNRICPKAMKHVGPDAKGMERSVLYLREGMDESELMIPIEGYHRFVLIVSIAGAEEASKYPFAKSYSKLEQLATKCESYCIIRLPPLYQNFNLIDPKELESIQGDIYGIDAENVGSAICNILSDFESHRGQHYTIFSPSGISPSTLKTVHSNLPRDQGKIPLQSSQLMLESIKSNYWENMSDKNDFTKITGGEEMTSFEEFLRRTDQSLFHQRFILKK